MALRGGDALACGAGKLANGGKLGRAMRNRFEGQATIHEFSLEFTQVFLGLGRLKGQQCRARIPKVLDRLGHDSPLLLPVKPRSSFLLSASA